MGFRIARALIARSLVAGEEGSTPRHGRGEAGGCRCTSTQHGTARRRRGAVEGGMRRESK